MDNNILFLDFDGVLNSTTWVQNNVANGIKFDIQKDLDKAAISNLNKIIEATSTKVVISSTWRLFFEVNELFDILKNHGFIGEVISRTPLARFSYRPRGFEIQEWMDENSVLPEKIVIIDDDTDMQHLKRRLVKINPTFGLTEKDVKKAIKLLKS